MNSRSNNLPVPQLSTDAASKVLYNVFEACELQPSTLPIDTLASYSEYRREKYSLQKYILLFVFVIFLVLPLFFIAPRLDLSLSDFSSDYPTYSLTVDSKIVPVSRVSAAIDGVPVSVYESGVRQFSITPTVNGELTVRVTLSNRQYNIVSATVEGIDVDSPDFLWSTKDDEQNLLYINVSETGSGLDPDGCFAVTVSGERMDAVDVDVDRQCVVFAFPDEDFTFFISDRKGNTLQLLVSVTPSSSGPDTDSESGTD